MNKFSPKEVKGGWTTTLDGDFRFCPKCGHPVYPINIGNSYTAYCNGCGSPLEDTTTSNTNKES